MFLLESGPVLDTLANIVGPFVKPLIHAFIIGPRHVSIVVDESSTACINELGHWSFLGRKINVQIDNLQLPNHKAEMSIAEHIYPTEDEQCNRKKSSDP